MTFKMHIYYSDFSLEVTFLEFCFEITKVALMEDFIQGNDLSIELQLSGQRLGGDKYTYIFLSILEKNTTFCIGEGHEDPCKQVIHGFWMLQT